MEELFDFVFYMFIAYAIWSIVHFVHTAYKRAVIMHQSAMIVAKQMHFLKVEQHADTMYWFDAETDQFIAQGKSIQDFQNVVKQVHPEKVFVFNNYCFAGPDFDPIYIDMPNDQLKKML